MSRRACACVRCKPHLPAALQVQHQRLSLGHGCPHLGPALPFLLHLKLATVQAVVPRERRLPLKMKRGCVKEQYMIAARGKSSFQLIRF